MVNLLPPPAAVEPSDAEALFKEARQHARRRFLTGIAIAGTIVAVLVVVPVLFVGGAGAPRTGAPLAPARQSAPAGQSNDAVQFRPVLAQSASTCRASKTQQNPPSSAPVSLLGPVAGSLPGVPVENGANADAACTMLGPAILSTSQISGVHVAPTPAGRITLAIVIGASSADRLHAEGTGHSTRSYAVVALGRVLSYPTGAQLAGIGQDGMFQVAGGLSPEDPLPSELSHALGIRKAEQSASPGAGQLQVSVGHPTTLPGRRPAPTLLSSHSEG